MRTKHGEVRVSEAVCLALYSTMNSTVRLYRDLLAPWGLTYQQLMVLAALWEDEAATPGQIAEALLLDSSSVAGLLGRMEKAGLIERDVDPEDRRRVRVRVSESGQAVREGLGWLEDCLTRAIALDPAQARDLVADLHRLRESVESFPRPEHPRATATTDDHDARDPARGVPA